MSSISKRLAVTLLATTVVGVGVLGSQSPAEARRLHHRASHSAAVHKAAQTSRHHASRTSRKVRRAQPVAARAAAGGQWMTNDGRIYQADPSANGVFSGSGSSLIAEARRWIGTNPTDRRSLWCARFMNFVLKRTGHKGTGSDMARSFASYGHRISGPQVGAIAVIARKGGGHVGVVTGVDKSGNPIIISGNHGHRVAEAVYPRGRVYAYVMPSS